MLPQLLALTTEHKRYEWVRIKQEQWLDTERQRCDMSQTVQLHFPQKITIVYFVLGFFLPSTHCSWTHTMASLFQSGRIFWILGGFCVILRIPVFVLKILKHIFMHSFLPCIDRLFFFFLGSAFPPQAILALDIAAQFHTKAFNWLL